MKSSQNNRRHHQKTATRRARQRKNTRARKKQRNRLQQEERNLIFRLRKTIDQYFPDLYEQIGAIPDCRKQGGTYSQLELILAGVMVVGFAQNMTYNRVHPVVNVVKTIYNTGVTLTKNAMDALEKRLERLPGIEKWFVRIVPMKA